MAKIRKLAKKPSDPELNFDQQNTKSKKQILRKILENGDKIVILNPKKHNFACGAQITHQLEISDIILIKSGFLRIRFLITLT